ncbi:hypothetical protein [Dyadobacter linearis]|nr:hypothetical protein [Dyadobacter sp. CECT 9623]
MKLILGKNYDIGLMPSMGSANCHLLMELCIGWGLEWVIIFDDKGAENEYKRIKKQFFDNRDADADSKIFRLADCDGIEDVFGARDLKLVNPLAEFPAGRKNSSVVSEYGGKELYSRLFYEKVRNGEITQERLLKKTVDRFSKVFNFIEEALDVSN